MRRLSLSFGAKLLASYLVLVGLVQGATVVALDRSLSADLLQQADARLEAQAWAVAEWIATSNHPERLPHRLTNLAGAHITVVDAEANVVGDSYWIRHEEAPPVSALDSPEFTEARQGRVGHATRRAAGGEAVRYVAVPVRDGMAVRLGRPVSEVGTAILVARRRVLLSAVIGLVVAVALGLIATRVVTRPVRAMTRAATQIAEGRYDVQLPTAGPDALGELAVALGSLARQLQARFDEIQRLEDSRRRFLADATHELRTPVTAILGYAQTLLDEAPQDTNVRQHVEVIHRHALRIGRLMEDLLALSHLEAHPRRNTAAEPVRVEGLAQRVVRTLRDLAESVGSRITLEVEPTLEVQGDPDAIERILENLVTNALKYGRRPGHVTVQGTREGNNALLQVHDDGPGIAAEHLPRLFERFYRVDQSRSRAQGGSGLGLAIVKQLAESMCGAVRVESVPGKGSTFAVVLPLATSSSEDR